MEDWKETIAQAWYFVGTLLAGGAFLACLTQLQMGASNVWWVIATGCAVAMAYYNRKSDLMQSLVDVEKVPLKEYWLLLKNDPRRKTGNEHR